MLNQRSGVRTSMPMTRAGKCGPASGRARTIAPAWASTSTAIEHPPPAPSDRSTRRRAQLTSFTPTNGPSFIPSGSTTFYFQVTCLACAQTHLVNPKNGKVLGGSDDE